MSESPKVVTFNADFAATDAHFRAMCAKAGVEPTRRQASKFRRHTGRAWDAHVATTRSSRQQEEK